MRTLAARLAGAVCVLLIAGSVDQSQALVLERGSEANWAKKRKASKVRTQPGPIAALPKDPQTTPQARKKTKRYRRRGRTKKIKQVAKEPEFHTYQPEPLVSIHDHDLKVLGGLAESSYSRWIFDTLRSKSKPVLKTQKADRKAILDFYSNRRFAPHWISSSGLTVPAVRLMQVLGEANQHGFEAARYIPIGLTRFDKIPEELFDDPAKVAKLEIAITIAALRYARHASGGQVDPNKIGRSYDLSPPTVGRTQALIQMTGTARPDRYLAGLHPSHPTYAALKAELVEDHRSQVTQIPAGRSVSYGQTDQRVPLMRARLVRLGFLKQAKARKSSRSSQKPDYFDKKLYRAVKTFQGSKGLRRDGIVGRKTLAALNGQKSNDLRALSKLNMERMRWLPRNFGRQHIIVNQAAYEARFVERGNTIHKMRVIIGKPHHPTPLFSDEMETVVFNPYWNVPRSIAGAEMIPRLKRDPGYLDRKGFQVIDRRGRKVRSRSVRWWNYTGETMPYDIRQPPGRRNALGELKFLFPNKHAVYMHDTPSRQLFNAERRAFSHGCVRVQNPRKFAEIILGWNARKVASLVATRTNRRVSLSKKIPVHLTYFTLWPNEANALVEYADIYGRDKALAKALKTPAPKPR
ncbi:MAG: L,D-transpeptidase family protein [Pseudomonadota bacterium]